MTAAEHIAEVLHRHGIDHVFFMEAILRRALMEMEPRGIKRVMAHTEKAAAYMADGYARATGKFGVCMAQAVGAANLAAGLQDAYLARVPLLAITGHKPLPMLHRNAYQEIAHAPLFQAVTRFTAQVESAAELPFLLRQALREATAATPRPVHLDLAGHLGQVVEDATIAEMPVAETRHGRVPAFRALPAADDIRALRAALEKSSRPIVVAGMGAVQSGAGEELQMLAKRGVAIAFALDAKGLVSDADPACLGVIGHYSAPYANALVHEADLVIFVGCEAGDLTTETWRAPRPGIPIGQIDADPVEIGRNYPGAIGACGDPKLALRALLEGLAPRGGAWVEHVAKTRRAWDASMAPRMASNAKPIMVDRLCRDLTASLPRDAILVADTGFSGIWMGALVRLNGAGQGFLRAAGSLGWGFPASLGAQCGQPGRPVICFCGDGGFYYHMSELETARRWNIPVTVVVNNNSALGQDIAGVRKLYEGRNGQPDDLTHFAPVDFAAAAAAFGVRSFRVDNPADLADALKAAIALNEPAVVEVVTDPMCRAPDSHVPPARD